MTRIGIGSLTGYIGEAMDKPPFSLAFVIVKESFVVPARLFYLASDANKNKRPDHLKNAIAVLTSSLARLLTYNVATRLWNAIAPSSLSFSVFLSMMNKSSGAALVFATFFFFVTAFKPSLKSLPCHRQSQSHQRSQS
jgi:hypothetical protein